MSYHLDLFLEELRVSARRWREQEHDCLRAQHPYRAALARQSAAVLEMAVNDGVDRQERSMEKIAVKAS